jgi:O-antigen/teichoic acid export membrane protein
LAIGFVLFGLIWLAIPLIVAYYQEPGLISVLYWVATTFLILPIGQQFQALLQRELRFNILSIIQITQNLFYAIVAIGFAWAGFGVMSLVWGSLIQVFVGVVLLLGAAIHFRWLPSLHYRLADLSGFAQFGLFQMGDRSLNYLATNVDYLIIGRFLGSGPLGYYSLAYNLIRLPHAYLNPAIVSVAFPAFSRVQHQDHLLRWGYGKIIHYLGAATFPIMGGIIVVAPLLIPIVYGDQWLPSVAVVQIFCLVGIWKSLGNPLGSLLLAKGRADLGFYMNLIALIGYAISNWLGVRWGINGVAFSTLLFQTAVLVPIGFYLRWLVVKMTAIEYWQALKPPLIAALVMISIIFPLYYALLPLVAQPILQMAILTMAGIGIYIGMIQWIDRPLLTEAVGYLKTK